MEYYFYFNLILFIGSLLSIIYNFYLFSKKDEFEMTEGEFAMDLMLSSQCPHTKLEGTLFTREQVDEISTRIAKRVSENVARQLGVNKGSSSDAGNKQEGK